MHVLNITIKVQTQFCLWFYRKTEKCPYCENVIIYPTLFYVPWNCHDALWVFNPSFSFFTTLTINQWKKSRELSRKKQQKMKGTTVSTKIQSPCRLMFCSQPSWAVRGWGAGTVDQEPRKTSKEVKPGIQGQGALVCCWKKNIKTEGSVWLLHWVDIKS